jgi:hypothetical protein
METRRQQWCWRGLLVIILTVVGAALVYVAPETSWLHSNNHQMTTLHESNNNDDGISIRIAAKFPEILMERVYSKQDFKNSKGIVPSFWEKQDSNKTQITWGPCYPPNHSVNWNKAMKRKKADYHTTSTGSSHLQSLDDVSDYCRPGFLIIGTGKSGTSSLYHYLTSHDRVLPASQKQIHYFKVRNVRLNMDVFSFYNV